MSENNTFQEQKTEQTVSTGRKIGMIFLSLVPVAVLVMIQTMAQVPFLILSVVDATQEAHDSSNAMDIYDLLLQIFNEKYSAFAYFAYVAVGLVVFGIWYYKGFVKKQPKVRIGEVFGVKSISAALCIGAGLFFVITAGMTLAEKIAPSFMESYAEMIETAGLVSNPIVTIVYAIILGPVLEELCFRGVVFGFLEKSGIKPVYIILITALLFGAIHMIAVQVIYATVIGAFLGFLRYKYRSLKITIFTHILFNFMGTYVSEAFAAMEPGDGLVYILGGISLFVLAFAIVLVSKDKKAVRS